MHIPQPIIPPMPLPIPNTNAPGAIPAPTLTPPELAPPAAPPAAQPTHSDAVPQVQPPPTPPAHAKTQAPPGFDEDTMALMRSKGIEPMPYTDTQPNVESKIQEKQNEPEKRPDVNPEPKPKRRNSKKAKQEAYEQAQQVLATAIETGDVGHVMQEFYVASSDDQQDFKNYVMQAMENGFLRDPLAILDVVYSYIVPIEFRFMLESHQNLRKSGFACIATDEKGGTERADDQRREEIERTERIHSSIFSTFSEYARTRKAMQASFNHKRDIEADGV